MVHGIKFNVSFYSAFSYQTYIKRKEGTYCPNLYKEKIIKEHHLEKR